MHLTRIACALGVMLAALPALAGSFLVKGTAAPATALIGQSVTFSFPVSYLNHETFACGLQVDFGDGTAPKVDTVQSSTTPSAYSVAHTYTKSSAGQPYGGVFIATLTPLKQGNMVACLGNGTVATVVVNAPVTLSPELIKAATPPVVAPAVPPVVVTKVAPPPASVVPVSGSAALIPKPPTIVASFAAASFPINGSTALTFTINNPNPGTLSGVAVSDTLPAGLVVSTPNGLVGSCGGGPLVASAGSSVINLKGAALAGNASCSFSLNVTGTTGGEKQTTTSAVTSLESGAGGTANASVTVDTAVDMLPVMDASVFPYGVKQGFKLTGDTKGKLCHFSANVLLDGNQLFSKAFAVALPWTSIDLQMPGGKNTNYMLALAPLSPADGSYQGVNACKGNYSLPFAVVPETGKLLTISALPNITATDQSVDFNVTGKTFGYCKYTFRLLSVADGSTLHSATVDQLPYAISTKLLAVGQYTIAADEIDDKPGMPEGCTGHLRSEKFSVVARPSCPAPQYAYKVQGDSEYGCLFPPSVQANITEQFSCPTGYDKLQSTYPSIQYGCHRQSAPPLSITPATPGIFQAAAPAAPSAALGSSPPAPAPDVPKITSLQLVAATGGAPRPNINVFYTGEDFKIDVAGNVPNKAGYGANLCGYSVYLENTTTKKQSAFFFNTFDIHSLGAGPDAGDYSVTVKVDAKSAQPHCLGSETTRNFKVYPAAAWITDLALKGWAHHFGAADAGPDEYRYFCDFCGGILSPAHTSVYLDITPTIKDGPSCAYVVSQSGNGDNRKDAAVYTSGQPAVPNPRPVPFMNQYGGSQNTVKVTVTGLAVGFLPPCNGTFTKTISFSDDPTKPAVTQ